MVAKSKRQRKKKEPISYSITKWIGTPVSVVTHTIFFLACFLLVFLGFEPDRVMLILTTIVSLEAIYLSIFIQITVNRNIESLKGVEEEIDEIQEDVEEINEDIGEIQEDVEELGEGKEFAKKDVVSEKDFQTTIQKLEMNLNTILEEIKNIKK